MIWGAEVDLVIDEVGCVIDGDGDDAAKKPLIC